MANLLSKIFGDANKRYLNSVKPIVEKINGLEKAFIKLSYNDLKNKTKEFRNQLNPPIGGGETLDDLLPSAFAVAREAAKRTLGQRHFDVQLIGGLVLHQGKIAQMA